MTQYQIESEIHLPLQKKIFCTKVSAPNNFFMIDLYLDALVRRLFKQKYSQTDLMHSPISKSEHSALVTRRNP